MYSHYIPAVHVTDETVDELLTPLPKGSASSSRHILTGEKIRAELNKWEAAGTSFVLSKRVQQDLATLETKVFDAKQFELQHLGIPHEPQAFVTKALQAGHPRSMAIHLDKLVVDALEMNMSNDTFRLAKLKVDYLWKWPKRSKELSWKEKQLKQEMDPHLSSLLLVFEEMLLEAEYLDTELVKDIIKGFPLMGWIPKSGVFPHQIKRPQFDIETLGWRRVLEHFVSAFCDPFDKETKQFWKLGDRRGAGARLRLAGAAVSPRFSLRNVLVLCRRRR